MFDISWIAIVNILFMVHRQRLFLEAFFRELSIYFLYRYFSDRISILRFGLFLRSSPSFMVFFGIVKVLVPKISQINLKRLLKAFLHTLCTFRVEFFLGDASGALHPFLVSVFVRRKGKKNSLEFVCWQNDWNGKRLFLAKTLIFFTKSDLFAIKYLLNLKTVLFIEMHPIACFKQQ